MVQKKGIQTRPIWGLIHEQKPYQENQSFEIQQANYYVQTILNLPCSSNLSGADVNFVVDSLSSLQKRSDKNV